MKRIILVLNIYCLFGFAYGKGRQIPVDKMSFNKIQSMQNAYINFLKRIESKQQYGKYKDESFSFLDPFLQKILIFDPIKNAYAADGDLCFFGGWPSKTLNNMCRRPWMYQSDSALAQFGPTYSSEFSCGGSNMFRCNPTLFGSPSDQGDKGYCVDTGGTYAELTQKCEQVSGEGISQIANEIKSGSEKGQKLYENLALMSQAIFGENQQMDTTPGQDYGFCDNFRTNSGEVYDACDDLGKRLAELSEGLQGEVVAGQQGGPGSGGINAPPNTVGVLNYKNSTIADTGRAQDVLDQCNALIHAESADDVYGRNIISYLQGGLATCNQSEPLGTRASFDVDDLDDVYNQVQRQDLVKNLNLKSLQRNLEGMLVMEHVFMTPDGDFPKEKLPLDDKEAFKKKVLEQFDHLKYGVYTEDIEKLIGEVFDNVNANKHLLPKVTFEQSAATLKELAQDTEGSVNKFCQSLHAEYKEKFKDRIRGSWTEWARSYSDDEKLFFAQKNHILKQRIDFTFHHSHMGFLMGTDVYQQEIMDPTIDYAKTCSTEPTHKVINPHMYKKQYQRALTEARDKLLGSFKDFSKDRMVKKNLNGESQLDKVVRNYLKNDKDLVVSALREMQGQDQENLAKYVCGQTKEIYDTDETYEVGGIVIGGLTSLAGGVIAMVGGVACPATAGFGCIVAVKGGKLAAVGGAIAMGTSSFAKGSDARTQQDTLNEVQLTNFINKSDNFVEDSRAASEREFDANVTLATSVGGAAANRGFQLYRGRQLTKLDKIKAQQNAFSKDKIPAPRKGVKASESRRNSLSFKRDQKKPMRKGQKKGLDRKGKSRPEKLGGGSKLIKDKQVAQASRDARKGSKANKPFKNNNRQAAYPRQSRYGKKPDRRGQGLNPRKGQLGSSNTQVSANNAPVLKSGGVGKDASTRTLDLGKTGDAASGSKLKSLVAKVNPIPKLKARRAAKADSSPTTTTTPTVEGTKEPGKLRKLATALKPKKPSLPKIPKSKAEAADAVRAKIKSAKETANALRPKNIASRVKSANEARKKAKAAKPLKASPLWAKTPRRIPQALNPNDYINNQEYLKAANKEDIKRKAQVNSLPSEHLYQEPYTSKEQLLRHLADNNLGPIPPEQEILNGFKNLLIKLEKIRDNKVKNNQLEREIKILKGAIDLLE